ncbi:sugar transferase [Aliiroseovarius sp. PrR006]|uniref:sugar transferase n=1 Tax=Aliiroseovarius sp. PrR006 TaxID=2706883 RepID=UPI0013D430E5|nr:sugar transferase [Aliiroseovarius sp. PrR006]NDW52461.1 sugar transferase [Aliiroseovarius sp. PrR006]
MKRFAPEGSDPFAISSFDTSDQPAVEPSTRFVKRAFDVSAAIILLILLSPVLLVIAVAVRLDSPGPILFRQPRHGLGGQTITVSKFRTMRTDQTDRSGAKQATQGDARVTKVGQFLRRTCLDELPQLWDVLAGKMSLVGPRPHPLGMEVEGVPFTQIAPGSQLRLRVRPGLTGLAQVSGNRGPVHDFEMARARVAYDNKYIDRWSFWLDVRILLRTVTLPFKKGCY